MKSETGTDAVNQIARLLEINTYADDIKTQASTYLENMYTELNEKTFDFRNCNISEILAKNLIEKRM